MNSMTGVTRHEMLIHTFCFRFDEYREVKIVSSNAADDR